MNYEQANQVLDNGGLVYRESWPTGTVLVKQGGYKADLEKWSDRSPLTKSVLTSLGTTGTLEIKPHVDIFQKGILECGYQFSRDDIQATNWKEYKAPVQEAPQQQASSETGVSKQSETQDGAKDASIGKEDTAISNDTIQQPTSESKATESSDSLAKKPVTNITDQGAKETGTDNNSSSGTQSEQPS